MCLHPTPIPEHGDEFDPERMRVLRRMNGLQDVRDKLIEVECVDPTISLRAISEPLNALIRVTSKELAALDATSRR